MKAESKHININDFLFLNPAKSEASLSHWIKWEDTEYLLKIESSYECYLEIFCAQIMHYLNIPTVDYLLIDNRGKKAIISPNYNQSHYPKINMKEIITKYNEGLNLHTIMYNSSYFCYETMKNIIKWYYPNIPESNLQKIYDGLFNQFISSVFLANTDLHEKNIEIFNPGQPTMAPCYDYNKCYRISFDKFNISPYTFKYVKSYKSDYDIYCEKPQETIRKFLLYGERKHIEEFKEKLEQLKSLKPQVITSQMESEIDDYIPYSIKRKLEKSFTKNLMSLNNIVNKEK